MAKKNRVLLVYETDSIAKKAGGIKNIAKIIKAINIVSSVTVKQVDELKENNKNKVFDRVVYFLRSYSSGIESQFQIVRTFVDEEQNGEVVAVMEVPSSSSQSTNDRTDAWQVIHSMIKTTDLAAVKSWWPRLLHCLFGKPALDARARTLLCGFHINGNAILGVDKREMAWYESIRSVLRVYGIKCFCFADRYRADFDPNLPKNADYQIALARGDGQQMLGASQEIVLPTVGIKTIVFAENKNSVFCKWIKMKNAAVRLHDTKGCVFEHQQWLHLMCDLNLIECKYSDGFPRWLLILLMVIMLILLPIAIVLVLFLLCACTSRDNENDRSSNLPISKLLEQFYDCDVCSSDAAWDIADDADIVESFTDDTLEVEADIELEQTSKKDNKKHSESPGQITGLYVVTVPGAPVQHDLEPPTEPNRRPRKDEVNQVLVVLDESKNVTTPPIVETKPSTKDNVSQADLVVIIDKYKHVDPSPEVKRKESKSPILVNPEENMDDRSSGTSSSSSGTSSSSSGTSSSFSFTIDCVPCSELANNIKEATSFCKECNDPLCPFCVKQHRRLRALDNHVIIELKCAQCFFAKKEGTPSGFCFDCYEFLCLSCLREHTVNKASRNHKVHEDIKTLNLKPVHLPEPIINKEDKHVRHTENSRERKLSTSSTKDNDSHADLVVIVEKSKQVDPPLVAKRKESNSPILVNPEEFKDDRSSVKSTSFSFTIDCVPCSELANNKKEATSFCKECNDPLCPFCVKQHRRFQALDNHVIIELKCAQCFCAKKEGTPSGFCFDCYEFLCLSCLREHTANKASRNHNIHEDIKTLNLKSFHLPEPIINKQEKHVENTESSRKRKLSTTMRITSSLSPLPKYEMSDGSLEEEDDLDLRVGETLTKSLQHPQQIGVYKVIGPGDSSQCTISSMEVLPNGDFILADCFNLNHSLKRFDCNFKKCSSLKLTSFPWDMCLSDSNQNDLYVTVPKENTVHVVTVDTGFGIRATIDVSNACWGVTCWHSGIALTSKLDVWELRFLDYDGNHMRTIQQDITRQLLFSCPWFLTTISSGQTIVISDVGNSRITAFDVDNETATFVFTDSNLKRPKNITVDDRGNIYVSCSASRNIYTISEDGAYAGILLSYPEELDWPRGICYNKAMDALVVQTNSGSSEVCEFKLIETINA